MNTPRPGRLLVVVDEWQREDPVAEDSDLKQVVVLLKSWCLPFDVRGLQNRRIIPDDLLNSDGSLKYGVVVWMARRADPPTEASLRVVRTAVERHGLGVVCLVAPGPSGSLPALLGVSRRGVEYSAGPFAIVHKSYIAGDGVGCSADTAFEDASPVVQATGCEILVTRGRHPWVTLRIAGSGGRVVWIGTAPKHFLSTQAERAWLLRSIADCQGVVLVKTWTNQVILRMDDPGSAQNAWLKTWHYPTLSKEQIREWILTPLEECNGKLTVFVSPGFVNDRTRSIEPSWNQRFVDAFGTKQDYVSTKAGLDEGTNRGLLEIQCHGWTHMEPDLESKPGPWWGSPLDGQRAEEEWYREFHDSLRHRDIPAAVQRARLEVAREWILGQFHTVPTAFTPPGMGVSTSSADNTWRIAAEVGFGWLDGYLGEDMTVRGWAFEGTDDVPDIVKVPPDGHDFGLTREPRAFGDYVRGRRGARFIGLSDYIAYLHTRITARLLDDSFSADVEFPIPLCQALRDHPSDWILLVSDRVRRSWRSDEIRITVDGATRIVPADQMIPVRLGCGPQTHYLTLGPVR